MGFQLDELLDDKATQICQSSIVDSRYTKCTYSKELICYDGREKILGYGTKEIILRFSEDGIFRSADITIDYTKGTQKSDFMAKLSHNLESKLEMLLCSRGIKGTIVFPNNRQLQIKRWSTQKLNIFLIYHLLNYEKSDSLSLKSSVSFVCLRIESKILYNGNYESVLKADYKQKMFATNDKGRKILTVPMRKQLGGLGGCAFSTMARQLAYIGSEITPLTVLIAFAGSEKQNRQLGLQYKFRYTSKGINNKPQAAQNCIDFITCYNREAAKQNIPLIKTSNNGEHISWCENIGKIDVAFAKSLKINSLTSSKYPKFKKMVQSYIDHGFPIGWTVTRHNGKGKHRRLIIGYNKNDDIIYYSDTWGRDNINTMPFISAYLMTVWVQYITY